MCSEFNFHGVWAPNQRCRGQTAIIIEFEFLLQPNDMKICKLQNGKLRQQHFERKKNRRKRTIKCPLFSPTISFALYVSTSTFSFLLLHSYSFCRYFAARKTPCTAFNKMTNERTFHCFDATFKIYFSLFCFRFQIILSSRADLLQIRMHVSILPLCNLFKCVLCAWKRCPSASTP